MGPGFVFPSIYEYKRIRKYPWIYGYFYSVCLKLKTSISRKHKQSDRHANSHRQHIWWPRDLTDVNSQLYVSHNKFDVNSSSRFHFRARTHRQWQTHIQNKKHLKNVGPFRHCEPPHAHSPDVASGTVARRLRIDVHDNDDNDNDNAWQRGPLWPNGMGPITDATDHATYASATAGVAINRNECTV